MEYCCFNGKAFPPFDFTANFQCGRHALSYVLVQVIVNAPLVQVKLLRAINRNPDSYLYSCLCECSLTLCWDEHLPLKPMQCSCFSCSYLLTLTTELTLSFLTPVFCCYFMWLVWSKCRCVYRHIDCGTSVARALMLLLSHFFDLERMMLFAFHFLFVNNFFSFVWMKRSKKYCSKVRIN